jgi:hypothetical protein
VLAPKVVGKLVSLGWEAGAGVDVRTMRGVDVLVARTATKVGELLTTGALVGAAAVTGRIVEETAVKLAGGTRVKVERTAVGVSEEFENGDSKAQSVTKNNSTNKIGANRFVLFTSVSFWIRNASTCPRHA